MGHQNPESEEFLRLQRAKDGDTEVWNEWFGAFYPNLLRYAFIRLRRRGEAEDIVSQVFLEALRGIDRYQYTGRPILAWFYRIAHNLVYDRLRAEERRADLGGETPASSDVNLGPESLIQNMDRLNALDDLTDEQRDVIIFRFFLGMPADEVGVIVGRSRAAVFSLQARALARLRQRLGEDFLK